MTIIIFATWLTIPNVTTLVSFDTLKAFLFENQLNNG